MKYVFKKDDLLARLRELRPLVVKQDKERIAEHRREERAFMRDFRAACREALKWDYETITKHGGRVGVEEEVRWRWHKSPPGCPVPRANSLDRMIAMVERSSQQRYSIGPDGAHRELYQLLTADVPKPEPAC